MKFWSLILFCAWASSSLAQSAFQNLDFELANPGSLAQGPFGPYAVNVPVGSAVPYWAAFYGAVQQSTINVNDPSFGSTAVTLYTAQYYPPIGGNYSLLLQGGVSNDGPTPASISQTGLIPSGSESLLFKYGNSQPPLVTVGGQVLAATALGTYSRYTLYACSISAFTGQTEPVTFSTSGFGSFLIDDISFSTTAVPEPNALALLGIGGFAAAYMRGFWKR